MQLPPNPRPEQIPREGARVVLPRGAPEEIRATWVGQSSFLLQMGGMNLLTDPVWSDRVSPVPLAGPKRLVPPGIPLASLPPIDAVLLSHDHYDHLDDPTVRRLHRRFGDAITWFAPLGHRDWLRRRGIDRAVELDWGETARMGEMEFTCLPAQHWTSRSPLKRMNRLWCSWAVRGRECGSVYFGGDSGWFPGYREIGERAGPFELVLMPIGAYEPRWFMRPAHMNPEEAVQAYGEMGGTGLLGGMHWGTFRLTDEDPLEPPRRCRDAFDARGFPPERLWIPAIGQTRVIPGPSVPAR